MNNFKRNAAAVVILALAILNAQAGAAEFDIDSGQTILRRLQLCSECGSSLLVTHVHPGVMVRCPDCGREQPRLQNKHLLTQVYQTCRLCQTPLDPAGLHPGDAVDCPNCRTRQILSRDAFLEPGQRGGLGYNPEFPPGTGKKTLIFDSGADNSLARVDAAVKPDLPESLPAADGPGPAVPLDLAGAVIASRPEAVFPPESRIPEPDFPPEPPLPEPPAAVPASGPGAGREPALDVPAVTADMFGGKPSRPAPSPAAPSGAAEGTIAARVNGLPIYRAALEFAAAPGIAAIRASDAEPAAKRDLEREHRADVLRQLIDRELAADEAERLGFKPDPAELRKRTAELAPALAAGGLDPRREAYRDLAMAAFREQLAVKPETISPKALYDFYQEHKQETLQPPRMAIAALTVFHDRYNRPDQRDYRAIAGEIAGKLEEGVKFDQLHERHNEFPAEPPAAMPTAQYAEEIRAATESLPPGAVFGPVFMSGVVVFGKITERSEARPLAFAEVEKDIRRRLTAMESEKRFQDWLVEARKQAAVTF